MRRPATLYIVLDGGRARFIERKEHSGFRTVATYESEHIHDRSGALGHKRPERVQESAAPARHGIEPRSDPKAKSERVFVERMVEKLSHGDLVKDFHTLVFVAPSRLLTRCREVLPESLRDRLAACIAKDLTKVPDREIARHLPWILSRPVTH